MELQSEKQQKITKAIYYEIKPSKTKSVVLSCLTYSASKLWNVANYERRNWDKESGEEYPNWYVQKKKLKNHFWYKNLPSQSAQEVLKQLSEAWDSFYKLQKTGGVKNAKPPRFKDGNFNIRFLNNGFVLGDDSIRLSIPRQLKTYLFQKYGIDNKFLYIPIPKNYQNISGNPKMVEISSIENGKYKVIIIVQEEKEEIKPADREIYMSIDPGINNLATCYVSTGETFIISGRQLLSIERYFSKETGYYQSISDAKQSADGIKYPKKSKRVLQLYSKRGKQIHHLLHSATKTIVDIAKEKGVTKVIVGDITNIREDKNHGRVNNQKLHKWPFKKFLTLLVYKLNNQGIATHVQEESYSSQCSPYSQEVSKEYAQKKNRKYRGLYKIDNRIYNADCVGAFNLMRKYLCRTDENIRPAVVGLDSPKMYRWDGYRFSANPKLVISMAM